MALDGFTIGGNTPVATPSTPVAPSTGSALKGFSIGATAAPAPVKTPATPISGTTALKGFTATTTPAVSTSTPAVNIDKLVADTKAPDTSSLFTGFAKANNINIQPLPNTSISGQSTPKSTTTDVVENLGKIPGAVGDVVSTAINTPLKKASDLLSNTKFITQAAAGLNADAGHTANRVLTRLSALSQGLSGLTGGLYKPLATGGSTSEDATTKIIKGISTGLGVAVSIDLMGGIAGGSKVVGAGIEGLTNIVNKFPLIAKYVTPFIQPLVENTAGISVYGQLDPKLGGDIKARVEKLGIDIATAPLYTALGTIKNAGISIPASFTLGFGMAKLSGASNQDALVSGASFAFLDGAGRIGGERGFTAEEIHTKLNDEALKILNDYSETKLTKNSTPEEFKAAFRAAAHQAHPDVGGSAEEFSKVKNAYDLLSKGGIGKTEATVTEPEKSIAQLKGDVQKGIEKYGESATHQALMTNLGVDSSTADRLVQAAKVPQTPAEIKALNEKILAQVNPRQVDLLAGEFDIKDENKGKFEIKNDTGGRSFGTIKGDTANIVNIDSGGQKGTHFFEKIVSDLSDKGIKTINVKLQNEDSSAVLNRMVEKGILSNPRNKSGSSNDEHFTTFDIVKDEMSPAERKAAKEDIKSLTPKSKLDMVVDKLVSGDLKIGVSDINKTESKDILGGHYPNIFRNDENLDHLDVVAHNAGVTGEELLQAYKDTRSASLKLTSGIDPGVQQFLDEDVLPAAGKALEGFKNTMKGLVHVLAPTHGVKSSDLDQIMAMKGARDKQEYIFSKSFEIVKKNFDKMSQQENINFIDRMKRGAPQATPALQAVADSLRVIDTEMWKLAQEQRPSLAWKDNHFRVLWKTVPGSITEEKGFKGTFNRPLQGTKGFIKQSTLADMSEGIAKGGVPISYNPIELFTLAYADMNKFITAQQMIAGFKEMGQMKFVKFGKDAPTGFTKLNDSIAKVYVPTGVGLPAQTGEWQIEENVGRILNNFLSKDHIRSTDFGRGLLAVKNAYTAVELSLSPFHAVFESLEAMGSSIGLGIQKVAGGNFKGGLKDIASSPVSPYTTAKLGGDAIKFLTEAGPKGDAFRQQFLKKNPNAGQLLDDLFLGGGKMKIDQGYQIATQQTFLNNINNGNYIGAALRVLPSLSKAITKPLFDTYIPQLKIGTFLKEYSNDLVENSKNLAEGNITRAELARTRWNFVEDRFGEMNFDNFFWNKTFKTALQLTFRSATWKIGNIRGTGGALWGQGKEFVSAAQQRRAPRMNPKFAWLLGMSIVTAIIATIVTYLMTKKYPASIQDFIYPKIDDKRNRVSTPTYWKDAFHLVNDPVGYTTASLSGDLNRIAEIWQNKDFYGTEIMDPNDPFYKRATEGLVHMIPVPFTVTSSISQSKTGTDFTKQSLSFFGFSKAPGYINNSDIQNKIYDLYSKRNGGVKSQDSAANSQVKSDIKKAYQSGNTVKANQLLQQAVKDGVIKETGIAIFISDADLPGDIKAFRLLPDSDQKALLKDMSPTELSHYAWYASSNVKGVLSQISTNASDFVQGVKGGSIKQPIFKAGKDISNDAKTPTFQNGSQTSNQSLIQRVTNYAKAIGTDPVTAFERIFTGQTIREVRNGTIIVERMSLSESQSKKSVLGGGSVGKGMILDHIVPLEGGGSNDKSNLQLITTAQDGNADNQPIEDFIGKEIKNGNMTSAQAREISIRFKGGAGQQLSSELAKEYRNKYGGKPLTKDQVFNYRNGL